MKNRIEKYIKEIKEEEQSNLLSNTLEDEYYRVGMILVDFLIKIKGVKCLAISQLNQVSLVSKIIVDLAKIKSQQSGILYEEIVAICISVVINLESLRK